MLIIVTIKGLYFFIFIAIHSYSQLSQLQIFENLQVLCISQNYKLFRQKLIIDTLLLTCQRTFERRLHSILVSSNFSPVVIWFIGHSYLHIHFSHQPIVITGLIVDTVDTIINTIQSLTKHNKHDQERNSF